MSLADLEARIRREVSFLEFPARSWMHARTSPRGHVYDVAIVGGGQSGLATAFGLIREQVNNIVVLDRNASGQEGPWKTFARMITLRTPKMVSGLDFGNPSLTPRAWYEAKWGVEAWNALDKIPREVWQDYLDWYRRILSLPVENHVAVTGFSPIDNIIGVAAADGSTRLARKVILCTGLDGTGEWTVPKFLSSVPRDRYAHTSDDIDFPALKGKRIGVLGNGASAFDNAATALEQGAGSVTLCLRKSEFPRINAHKWMETSGFLGHYWSLPDRERWRFMRRITGMSQPPPQDTLWRCVNFPNFSIKTGAGWDNVFLDDGAIAVETPKGRMTFDFLICGTGISNVTKSRPELATLSDHIATWNDVFTPPPGEEDAYQGSAPYLGPGFQFLEKLPGTAPYLSRIHNFTYGATLSMGLSASSISGMKYGLPRLIQAVVGDLFREDADHHFQNLLAYADKDITTLELPEDRSRVPDVEVPGSDPGPRRESSHPEELPHVAG
jgi:cation diffusion facilitator CzcD-associated flavoprotein CzcO